MERITTEEIKLADGSIQKSYIVTCSVCGLPVFINTITKNPKDFDYYCVNCGNIVEEDVIDEIIRMNDQKQEFLKNDGLFFIP